VAARERGSKSQQNKPSTTRGAQLYNSLSHHSDALSWLQPRHCYSPPAVAAYSAPSEAIARTRKHAQRKVARSAHSTKAPKAPYSAPNSIIGIGIVR
jgi:hypothetical protein